MGLYARQAQRQLPVLDIHVDEHIASFLGMKSRRWALLHGIEPGTFRSLPAFELAAQGQAPQQFEDEPTLAQETSAGMSGDQEANC